MRAAGNERGLRFVAPTLAAAVVAVGGFVVATARADPTECDEATPLSGVATAEVDAPCGETESAAPTVTETGPVEEPSTTETTAPTEPPAETTTTVPPAPPKGPATTTASPRPQRPATASGAPAGVAGGGQPLGRAPHTGMPELSGGPYVFPVLGATSFGDTWGAPRATVAWHHGVDIFAPRGAPVVAVADGVLFSVGWNRIGGRRLWLRDRQGNYFYYAHLSAFSPTAIEGARVGAGTVIGYVGNTGDALGTPDHLHFEIHPVSLLSLGYDGAVNPFPYVSSWRRLRQGLDGSAIAAASPDAPAPGAFLLGYEDISSASGLTSASLERTLERTAVSGVSYDEVPRPHVRPSTRTFPRRWEEDAGIARALDAQAALALGSESGVWDTLAVCESGCNWGTNTGNGYSGGLQFHPQTWLSHGGAAFAPSAHLATREEQITVAERVLGTQGWRAWPACSALLGLGALSTE